MSENRRGAEIIQFDQAAYQAIRGDLERLQGTMTQQVEFFASLGRSMAAMQRSIGEIQQSLGELRGDVSELRSNDALNQMRFDAARSELSGARRDILEAAAVMREALARFPQPDADSDIPTP